MWKLYKISKVIKAILLSIASIIIIAFYFILSDTKEDVRPNALPDQLIRVAVVCHQKRMPCLIWNPGDTVNVFKHDT